MEIIVAKSAGFCFGVNRAIEYAYNQINKGNTSTYGPIIHNKEVTDDLKRNGINAVENFDNINNGTIIIRSHGVGKSVYDEIKKRKLKYIDGTCPFVKKIHDIVCKDFENGQKIIIIGSTDHPEIQGINGWCENSAVIIDSKEQIKDITINSNEKYTVVVQTTFRYSKYNEIKEELEKSGADFKFYNTICSATAERQNEAIELSSKVDTMIVIGDKKSSNTQKLYEICKKNCNNTIYIETYKDLLLNIFCSNDKIGITAGASTPPAIIKEVICKMSEIDTQNKNNQENEDLTFQQLLDESLVTLHTGDVVEGTVIQIVNEEVSVNLGYKSDGIIPRGEFSSDSSVLPSKVLQPGDKVEVFVVRVNDGDGNVLLSKKRTESLKGMVDIEKAYEEKTPVTGKVTEIVKGGLIAIVNGVRVFIPSSQVSNRFVEDLNIFKNQEMTFNIIELEKNKRRIIGGRKALIEKEQAQKKEALFSYIKIGDKIKGTVSRITDFGAFVDLGGVDGLIHISQMSWGRISNPKEILSEGQEVEVVILDINTEKGKISLSLKEALQNPWSNVTEKYQVGSIIKGKVVRMVPFGAFIELEPGVDGLVHISQIANKHVNKPEDELKIGELIDVKVIEINSEQKKISLSKREAEVSENTEENTEA